MSDITIHGWQMEAVGSPVTAAAWPVGTLPEGEVLVEVAGCGVCHTDISFLHMGVPTRMKPPLTLGHEISGTVVEAGPGVDAGLVGKPVLVPAVLPCGVCALCTSGHRRICRVQIMPGNDRHGGFATHVAVPAKFLCEVPDAVLASHELWELAIISDAVTTPFQAAKRAGLAEGETAVVIGTGGIGIHMVQVAAAVGAKVVALDIDARKLEQATAAGAGATIDVSGLDGKAVKNAVKGAVKGLGGPTACWRIFETSGTRPGQETGFGLLGSGGKLAIVGFTMDKLEVRLSNLMAFDAEMFGIWGCDPLLYPEALDWVAKGRIAVKPYVERHALSEINEVLDAAHAGALERRAVMVP